VRAWRHRGDAAASPAVGTHLEKSLAACNKVTGAEAFTCETPEKWDGHAAERIADILVREIRAG